MNIFYYSVPIGFGDGSWLSGVLMQTPNGLGIQLADGSWLSIQPNGSYETRDGVNGTYEQLTLDPQNNIVRVTPAGLTYAIFIKGR